MCNPWKVSLCLALAAVIGCAGSDGTGKGTTDKKASLEGVEKKVGEEAKKIGEETKEKAGEAVKKVGEFTAELKDKHLGEMKDKLGGCDKQIAELKQKLDGLTGDAKTQLAAKIGGLEELRKKTGEAFDKLKDGTKDNWAERTKEFGGMMEKLTNGIKDADEHVNKK